MSKNREIFSTQGKMSTKLVSINRKEIISYRTCFRMIIRLSEKLPLKYSKIFMCKQKLLPNNL